MARAAKKEKVLTPDEKLQQALVPVEEQPYEVPGNWCWAKVGNICSFIGGGTPSKNNPEYWDGLIPWASVKDIKGDYLYETIDHITNAGYENSASNICDEEDLLLVTRIEPAKTIVAKIRTAINQDLKIVKSELPSVFLNYYFRTFRHEFELKSSGSTVKGITIPNIENTPFPLPPLAEQHRIVSRIESLFAKLDEAREKAQAVVDGFEDRKAAILHKAFTGKLTAGWRRNNKHNSVEFYREIQHKLSKSKKKKAKIVQNDFASVLQKRIPSEWMLVDLDSISRLITDGEHKTPNRVDSFCGFYLLSARNILNDSLKLDDVDYVDSDEYEVISKRCNPKKGDILLSCSGSVGRCCVVNDTNHYCMVRSAAMISQEGCNSRYLMYMIQSDAVQEQITSLSKQTAQANLFLGAIASLVIPLPSREEQDKMTQILDDLMKKNCQAKVTAEQVIIQINEMKKSILARAFRGELGTNNPTDESAEELLKRIL